MPTPNIPLSPTGSPLWTKGVDVNHFDSDGHPINWHAVLNAGIGFAFVKATQGTGYTDPSFATNWQALRGVGLTRGAYHFATCDADPTAQAEHFLAVVKGAGGFLPTDLPAVLDIENQSIHNTRDPQRIVAFCRAWLSVVGNATGKPPLIYTSPGFAAQYLDDSLGAFPLWVAHYGVSRPTRPEGWHSWRFWQSSAGEDGTQHVVPGIAASVDIDWYPGDHAALVAEFCHAPTTV